MSFWAVLFVVILTTGFLHAVKIGLEKPNVYYYFPEIRLMNKKESEPFAFDFMAFWEEEYDSVFRVSAALELLVFITAGAFLGIVVNPFWGGFLAVLPCVTALIRGKPLVITTFVSAILIRLGYEKDDFETAENAVFIEHDNCVYPTFEDSEVEQKTEVQATQKEERLEKTFVTPS